MSSTREFMQVPVSPWVRGMWLAPGLVLGSGLAVKAVVDAQPVFMALAGVCLVVAVALFQRKSGKGGPISVGPEGLRFTAPQGEAIGLGWDEIRYFDFADRTNPAKGPAFVSFEQAGQGKRSVAIPLKRLAARDQAAMLQALEEYWPDCRSGWQEQLQARVPATVTAGSEHAPRVAVVPELGPEQRAVLRRMLEAGEVVEFKRSGAQLLRIAFNFLILAGYTTYSLVQWGRGGMQYDLIVGVVFGLWAFFILAVASRRGRLARIDAQGLAINGLLRWREVPYQAMRWIDFDTGKRAGVVAYGADGETKDRYAVVSKRLLSAEFIAQMRVAIADRRPDIPARNPRAKA